MRALDVLVLLATGAFLAWALDLLGPFLGLAVRAGAPEALAGGLLLALLAGAAWAGLGRGAGEGGDGEGGDGGRGG